MIQPSPRPPRAPAWFRAALTIALAVAGCAGRAEQAAPAPPTLRASRPNIVVIMADDHAAHAIGSYGSVINRTPNIDRLAREGLRFTNAFCENSLCSPSRAAILTGKYSHANGVPDLKAPLPVDQITFPELLREVGYETAFIGKWHLHRHPTGFDHWEMLPEQGEYYDPAFISPGPQGKGVRTKTNGYATDIITDKSIAWLRSRDPDKPFLLLTWHKAPHRPWSPPKDARYANLYEADEIPYPPTFDDDYATRSDAARRQAMSIERNLSPNDLKQAPPPGLQGEALKRWKYQRYIKDYLRCIASLDDNVGRLLDFLDAEGLASKTIVIYTSDQGFFLGDHGWYDKRFMYEEALRMPLLVRFPGAIVAGTTCDRPVLNIDFAPTLLDLAGADAAPTMQGVSLRPLLEGRSPSDWRTATYYHYYDDGPEHNVAAHFGLRTDRYKLIRFYGKVEAWELYDLHADPRELHNLAGDPAHARILAELKDELSRQRRLYGDTAGPDDPPPQKE